MHASFKTAITMQVNRFLRSLKVTFCPKFETHFQYWFRISWFAIGGTNHIRKVLCKLGFATVIPEKFHWVPSVTKYSWEITFVSQKMQHATLTDTKGYGPAWSIERSVKEQSVKETNKQFDNIQWLCVCINTSKIIKYNLEFLLTLSGQDIVHYH